MRRMRFGMLLPTFLLSGVLAAQWTAASAQELVGRLDGSRDKFMSLDSYKVRSTISVFLGPDESVPHEKGISTVWKSGMSVKAEHLGFVSYQDASTRVSIDDQERVIVIGPTEDLFMTLGDDMREQFFKASTRIERSEERERIRYRVHLGAGADFESVDFLFDTSGWLRALDSRSVRAVPLSPGDPAARTARPRLLLEMDVPEPLTDLSMLLAPKDIVSLSKHGAVGLGKWKDFEIIDNRLIP